MLGSRERSTPGGQATAVVALCVVATLCGARFGRAEDAIPQPATVPPLERSDYYLGDGLADVPSPVREALEAFIAAEFATERPATPERFANGYVDALVAGGLSEEDAVRTVATFAARGHPVSFADRRRMTTALAERLPKLDLPDSLSPPEERPNAPLPPGGVVVEDFGHPSALSSQRYLRKDPSWLPRDAFEMPVEMAASVHGLSIGAPGVTGEDDTLRLNAFFKMYVESPGGDREQLTGVSLTFTEPVYVPEASVTLLPWTLLYYPRSILSVPKDSRVVIEVRYEATHHAPGVKAEDRAAVVGTVRHLVVPRRAHGGEGEAIERFDLVPLGPDDKELPCPEAIGFRTATNLGAFVLDRKSFWQERIRRQREDENRRQSLVGRDLRAVPLRHGADGMPGELALSPDRTHLLLFGATWCGPCHAVAPSVEKLIGAFHGREDAPIVHRLSVDDDPEVFAAALEAYPSGVCTEAFQEDLVVDAIPKYFLIRGGRIVEQGGVDEAQIASWREAYAP